MKRFSLIILVLLQLLNVRLQAAVELTAFTMSDENAPWHPTKIQQDRRGLIWVGSWNGLFRYDGYHFQSFKPEPGQGIDIDNDRIRDLMLVSDDSLLCRVEDRVYTFNVSTCRFDTLPDGQQEAFKQRMLNEALAQSIDHTVTVGDQTLRDIRQRFVDRQGNQWLCSNDHIYRLHDRQQHGARVEGAASQDVTRCLYRDSEGCYWLCTRDKQQVVIYDPSWQCIGYLGQDGALHSQPTSFASIYCVFDDGKGTLWLGSKPDGMYRLKRDNERFRVEHLPISTTGNGLPTTSVYDIQVDSLGTLWLASWDDGILCIDNPAEPIAAHLNCIKLADRCPAFPTDALKSRRILIRPDGTLLAATTRGLLVIDNIYTSLSQMTMRLHRREAHRSASLMSSATMSMIVDAKDRLFVATESGGVSMTNSDLHAEAFDFKHYSAREGLASEVAFSLVTTPKDLVMVVCPNGISIIDADNDQIETYGPRFWNTDNPFTECTPYIEHDSQLILTHEEGILLVPTQEFTQQGYCPDIAITSVTIGQEPTRYDMDRCDTIYLSPSQRSVVISYSALDLRSNSNLRYRTRIGDQWSPTVDAHEVTLQDLHPGTYQLQICSSNAVGQWPDNVRTLTIIVKPQFLESWYGRLLMWLLLAAVGAFIAWLVLRMRSIDTQRHDLLQTYLALLESTTKDKIAAAAQTTLANPAINPKTDHSAAIDHNEVAPNAAGLAATPTPHASQHLSLAEQQFMQRLMDYVEENISNSDASLADMAEATATSKSSLTRKTHQILGVTPADFLKEARLKRASQLLLTTTQSLTEISLACGFSDPKYFSKCFKASTGKTPTEFRS